MTLVLLLFVVASVLAYRAYSTAAAALERSKDVDARLTAIEHQLSLLRRRPAAAEPETVAIPPAPPVPPAPSVPVTPPPVPVPIIPAVGSPATVRSSTTLEGEIGSRWMLLVGVVVLVLGVAFFVKYAFDRQWINETARVAIGFLAGLAVLAAGLRFARREYVLFGRMIAAGGLAMMFVSAWAATALYGLVSANVGFIWLVSIAGAAGIAADRHRSVGLALVSMVFAYAVPGIVRSEADRHIFLFTYEAILAVVSLVLVMRHGWPALGLVAWYLTWTTFGFWFSRAYRDSLFASAEIYLIFVSSIFASMIWLYRKRPADPLARAVSYVLCAGPVVFHVASLTILFNHPLWFLVYLIAVTALSLAVGRDRPIVRLLAWLAVAVPFAVWSQRYGATGWYAPALIAAAAIYVLHLFYQLQASASNAAHGDAELALFQLNGLGMFGIAYLLLEPHAVSTPLLAGAWTAWYLALVEGFRRWRAPLVAHGLATAFTLMAVTISLALTGPWVTAAYAAEGAAIVAVGLRSLRLFFRCAGALLLAFAAMRLVSLQFGRTAVSFTPLVNSRMLTGAFIVGLLYAVAAAYKRHTGIALDERRRAITLGIVAANVLTVALLTADADSFWTARLNQLTADFSRQLTISVIWGVYAMGAIWFGFARQSKTLRYFGLALFGLTIVKMFTVDLLELDGIYRITGFLAVGLVLLSASFLYQRHRASIAR